MRRLAWRSLLSGPSPSPRWPAGATTASVSADDAFDPTSSTVSVGAAPGSERTHQHRHVDSPEHRLPTQTTGSFMRTFPAAGSYVYYCTIHGGPNTGMHGTIVVQ
jgi:plastocyanin